MLGYAGKYLEVDLSHVTFKNTVFGDEVLKDYVGGRALATKILSDRLIHKWDEVDPLESDNVLQLLTGPITGYFPGGRVCVSGKSPQSNGVVGSTVGGEFGVELRCAGYDGIIVTGKAEKPVYLFIKDSDVEIRDAKDVWGKDCKETNTLLNRDCRKLLSERYPRVGVWKEPAKLLIGPAGEQSSDSGGYGKVDSCSRLWWLRCSYGFQKPQSSCS
ncbi:MAG TPA: aldehyde ferredoxin oxidoreductase N-terminal domain-containing protein [Candidatus Sulfotelmatobacter sp.]|nr:aldehyde ferredoxin oxidoreductase N-terminal domain-containing protein [Candidatus Sulfotelmatobacter sp.]